MSQNQEVEALPVDGVQAPQDSVLPAVDIVENDQGITLYADLPGVPKERLEIRVDGENLILEGAATLEAPPDLDLLHGEVRHAHYRRSFTLSRELDATHIAAHFADGVLKLHIPKAESARARRIEIREG